jgi:polysaccharide export outer membrane protein
MQVEHFTLAATNAAATPEAPADAVYRLGIGDVLAVSIYGEDGSLRELPVDPSGNLSYLMIGTVAAAGRTIDELRIDLQERVSARLARGLVQVVPVRFGSQVYTILGELNYPGTYLMEGRTTILDAIARARGIRTGYFRNSTAEMADFRNALLMRNRRVVPVDFEALISRGDGTQNVELRNGDVLSIPSSLVRNVYVLGEVHFPRTVGFVSSLSLMQALTEARGLKNTSDGRIVVVRGSLAQPEARVVRFEKILAGKHPNLALAPGDIVFVPPQRLALMRDIVETAIAAFAHTVSAGSASHLYQKAFGPTDRDGP